MRGVLSVMLLAGSGFTADQSVVRPRDSAASYPVHAEQKIVAVGAEMLTSERVHGTFSSELNRVYLVVEVGLFPNEQIDVSHLDFSLVPAGTRTMLRPVQAKVVAAVLQKSSSDTRQPSAPGDITLYPTAGVGYESGTVYDPVTGRRRGGGWSTSTGVRVAVGGPAGPNVPSPASTSADRRTMETELTEKGLPEGPLARPVAGYLYFPFPGKKKEVAYDLEYRYRGEKLLLPLGKYSAKR